MKKKTFIIRNFNARKIRQINIEALDNKVTRVVSVTFFDPFIQKTYKLVLKIKTGPKVSDDARNIIGIF